VWSTVDRLADRRTPLFLTEIVISETTCYSDNFDTKDIENTEMEYFRILLICIEPYKNVVYDIISRLLSISPVRPRPTTYMQFLI
jgi:hypothetical protein